MEKTKELQTLKPGDRFSVPDGDYEFPAQIEAVYSDGSAYVGMGNTGDEWSADRLARFGYRVDSNA